MDSIIQKKDLIKFLKESRSIDPKRKGIYTIDDLPEF